MVLRAKLVSYCHICNWFFYLRNITYSLAINPLEVSEIMTGKLESDKEASHNQKTQRIKGTSAKYKCRVFILYQSSVNFLQIIKKQTVINFEFVKHWYLWNNCIMMQIHLHWNSRDMLAIISMLLKNSILRISLDSDANYSCYHSENKEILNE